MIYPNPANQFINVELSQLEEIRINIIDATGKLLISKGCNSVMNEIDISEFPKGIYLVQVTSKKGNTIRKIMKY